MHITTKEQNQLIEVLKDDKQLSFSSLQVSPKCVFPILYALMLWNNYYVRTKN
ncbi:hypothetical protein KFK09_002267 [Dendrobium nobile]|uniref:Uncharacterized protein n=1 Tax=Dendrobium nobile TaxID=94219 RepID=A0A8T3C7B8_DENNO|nr:hypothetical protein KFK09_002267 [Dendrobium nobile]